MAYTSSEKKILGTTGTAHFLSHLHELAFPAIALTLSDDMGWTLGEVLRLSFLMYLLYGVGALPMGMLTDRWSAHGMLIVCMVGTGVGSLLVALAPGKTAIVASLGLIGLANSIAHPAGMALISRSVRERGKALGLNGVFGNLGSASAPLVGGVLAFEFGWRAAYAVLGGLALVGAVVGLVFSSRAFSERAARIESLGAVAREVTRKRLAYFGILCLAMMLAGFSYRGVSLVLPATFREQASFLTTWLGSLEQTGIGGLRNLAATTLASFVYAVGIGGQLLGGALADRHDLRKLYLAFHAASLPALLLMAFLNEGLLLMAACVYVFFSLGMQPIENSLVAHLTPERWRSTSYGVKFILNFGVGSTAVYAVSALQAGGSFVPVYLVLCTVVLLLCGSILFLLYASRGTPILNRPAANPIS